MWFLLSPLAAAAPGPFAVGFVDRPFDRVPTRTYFPAVTAGRNAAPDPSVGPYPLAVFLHGWLGSAWMYDTVCEDLASHGFVVVSLDTQTGLILDMERFADDAVDALHGVEAASADPADPLTGLVSAEPWTAMGHSMGGATLSHLLALEPRIETAVAFMPYEGSRSYYDELAAYDGSYLVLTGTHDTTAPPALQREWFAAAEQTHRSLWVTVQDMGHQAVTDLSFEEDPMPDAQQRTIVTDLATNFVLAEHRGEEDRWSALTGPGLAGIDATLASRSHAPALWTVRTGDTIELGVAGLLESTAEIVFGTAETADGLADPLVAGEVAMPAGVGTAVVDLPVGWEGALLVRVHVTGPDGDAWTRAITLIEAEPVDPTTPDEPDEEAEEPEEEPTTEPPATDPDPVEEPRASRADAPRGCSTVPALPSGALVLLGLAASRRRRTLR